MAFEAKCCGCGKPMKPFTAGTADTPEQAVSAAWEEGGVSDEIVGAYSSDYDTHHLFVCFCRPCTSERVADGRLVDMGSFLKNPKLCESKRN